MKLVRSLAGLALVSVLVASCATQSEPVQTPASCRDIGGFKRFESETPFFGWIVTDRARILIDGGPTIQITGTQVDLCSNGEEQWVQLGHRSFTVRTR
jgi:hypothetical protein